MKNFFIKYKKYIFLLIISFSIISIILFININRKNTKEINDANNIVFQDDIVEKQEVILEETIEVEIKGSVYNPGVYEMKFTDRVIDVINAAGGLTKNADISLINLSKKITDEMVIKIYTKAEVKEMEEKNKQTIIEYVEIENDCKYEKNDALIENSESNNLDLVQTDSKKISLNIATKEQLDTLPGIGISKAEDIINYRDTNGLFKNIEEIKNVNGIGDNLFEKIKEFIEI